MLFRSLINIRVYTDIDQLINDPQIDLVDVLLPHHLHYPVAMKIIQAHKHLLLEKPIALTYKESLEIVHATRQAGINFGVAENTHYVPAYITAEKMIRNGQLGDITLVRSFLPANERVRLACDDFWGKQIACGGGVLIDSAPHTFYLLKWLFGEVEQLSANISQIYKVGSEVEDNADIRGYLKNGAYFQSSFTFTAEIPHSERLEVYGTKGSLIIDQLANPPARFYTDPTDFDGTPVENVTYDPMGWHFFSIVEEVKDFIRTIIEDKPSRVDPFDCCYAVYLVEKAYESVNHNSKLIQVQYPPQD